MGMIFKPQKKALFELAAKQMLEVNSPRASGVMLVGCGIAELIAVG
jgi:hypothetical protein